MFETFVKEKRYLKNVTQRTEEWYGETFKWLGIEAPTEADLKDCVIRMRQKGLTASSCNNRIRAINSYLHWLVMGIDKKCGPACQHLRIQKINEEQRILPTYTPEQLKKLIDFKPKGFYERRLYTLILTKIDTGVRISELIGIKKSELNLDGLYFKVLAKGKKERLIPFSISLRRYLVVWQRENEHELLFPTADGFPLGRRDVLRDLKQLCLRLGFKAPERSLHALRHTFAVNYLRQGGSVFHLQRALGHTSLEQSRKYANLMNEDLQEMQQKVSILNRMR
jgi:integrase/recombinase XerD